ncbi:MAG TPA: hypothetical protein VL120_04630 [Solirubrobacteraceae bacterium]|nr:hypothetical protein [Solirubrobacteraceae bacterium]
MKSCRGLHATDVAARVDALFAPATRAIRRDAGYGPAPAPGDQSA